MIINQICILGAGYIGLPTAALLASKGFDVTICDIKNDVVELINSGQIHIVEPGLLDLVETSVAAGRLKASLHLVEADVYIIAVPTPFDSKNNNLVTGTPKPDLKFVYQAAQSIATVAQPGSLVILESTSPVGTTRKISSYFSNKRCEKQDFYFAHCPERVLPGNILFELENNDRVVGGLDPASTEIATDFYHSFISGNVHSTSAETAEMCKLVENAYRDVNIAFANEVSMIAHDSIDVAELINLANFHPRVNILKPGCGVGGHCIAVDPWFLVDATDGQSELIHKARQVNDRKTEWVTKKIINEHKKVPTIPIICYGLTYKPDIDDIRESPALKIAIDLMSADLNVFCVEPNLNFVENIKMLEINEAISQTALHVMLVPHKIFSDIKNFNGKYIDFS